MATAKKPQDHKPKFHDISDLFEYTLLCGETVSLPYVENMPNEVIFTLPTLAENEMTPYLFKTLMSEEDYETFRTKGVVRDTTGLTEQWQAESALNLGEL